MLLEVRMREGQGTRLGFRFYQGGRAIPFQPGSITWTTSAPGLQLVPADDGTTCTVNSLPGQLGNHIVNVAGLVDGGAGPVAVSDTATIIVEARGHDGAEIVVAEPVRDLPPPPWHLG